MARKRSDLGGARHLRSAWRHAIVGALGCAGLFTPGALMGATRQVEPTLPTARLTAEQRVLHALNRLTFGPRPGDPASVARMGLEAWFQRQLHPELIPDDALGARLAQFPAMQLTQANLVSHFPTPEMLRRYSRGALALPEDEVERVIYADASLSYEEKREGKESAQNKAALVAAAATAPVPIVRRGPGGDSPVPVAAAAGASTQALAVPDPMSAGEIDAVLALPADARMQRLLAMSPEQMAGLMAALKGPERERVQERLYAGMSPWQKEQVAAMRSPERVVEAEVLNVRLLRDVYSERQLQAVMTDFWLNHFSVYLHKNGNEPYLLPAYEREAILPHALGKFEDLLVATAKSPAMLVYLDNWESVGPGSRAAQRAASAQKGPAGALPTKAGAKGPQGINENYARELMELHTLGVKGGYTQADVVEVARCFTGWTIDRPAQGGEFLFNPNRHEPGTKDVLGHTIQEGGMNEGLQVLHLLATSPATAHFVSEKLAERFVSDAPPPALVNRMAATYLKSDGDMAAVLTSMFHSSEFWSPAVYRAKVKTPLEFVASTLRATNAEVTNPAPLVQALDRLGMPIYGMPTPNGYSWQADAWVSSNALLTRMNFALVLSANRVGGTRLQWPALLAPETGLVPESEISADAATEQRLEQVILNTPATPQTRAAALTGANTAGLQGQAEQSMRAMSGNSAHGAVHAVGVRPEGPSRGAANRNAPETPLATMAGLLLGSPDFQRR